MWFDPSYKQTATCVVPAYPKVVSLKCGGSGDICISSTSLLMSSSAKASLKPSASMMILSTTLELVKSKSRVSSASWVCILQSVRTPVSSKLSRNHHKVSFSPRGVHLQEGEGVPLTSVTHLERRICQILISSTSSSKYAQTLLNNNIYNLSEHWPTIHQSRVKNNDWRVFDQMAGHFWKWLAIWRYWLASIKDSTSNKIRKYSETGLASLESLLFHKVTANCLYYEMVGHNGQPLGQMVGHLAIMYQNGQGPHVIFNSESPANHRKYTTGRMSQLHWNPN